MVHFTTCTSQLCPEAEEHSVILKHNRKTQYKRRWNRDLTQNSKKEMGPIDWNTVPPTRLTRSYLQNIERETEKEESFALNPPTLKSG